jgi:type III pantothenate kinase
MTVDALTDTGEFLGGIITPGIDLMQKILMTDIVSLKSGNGKLCDYPDSTMDAICSGAMHATAGAIERMAVMLAGTLGRVPDVILTGGSAQQLLPQLNVNAKVVDNLVLRGLLAIAQENPQAPL